LARAPALTVKLLLVALASDPSEADKVKVVPATVGIKFEKVATPLDADTVVVEVPLNAPGELIVILTLELSVVTTLPFASCTCTVTAGEIAEPALVVLGCTLKASLLAAPAVMLKPLLVAPVNPVLLAASV
jgi:hypothetical protein